MASPVSPQSRLCHGMARFLPCQCRDMVHAIAVTLASQLQRECTGMHCHSNAQAVHWPCHTPVPPSVRPTGSPSSSMVRDLYVLGRPDAGYPRGSESRLGKVIYMYIYIYIYITSVEVCSAGSPTPNLLHDIRDLLQSVNDLHWFHSDLFHCRLCRRAHLRNLL
jgi:hypothetical protein